jgi:AraC family transcriptional regulator
LAEIAAPIVVALAERVRDGSPGRPRRRVLASGHGWTVEDVICTCGPGDRPFEEQHPAISIAIVVAGTFQYRSRGGRELMTPGSLLLGTPRQPFECGHEHAAGDRCLSFHYQPDVFERLAGDAGGPRAGLAAWPLRVPAIRALSPVISRAAAGLLRGEAPWEELSVELAGRTSALLAGADGGRGDRAPAQAEARVTRVLRSIERSPDADLTLAGLAASAGTSRYHFLRMFERLTGVTPHRYIRRMRLREAAVRLAQGGSRILDVALDCGFGDVSNFNRAFRAEFGVSPGQYRG